MRRRLDISRRELLTGALTSRNAALAFVGAIAWTHVLDESRGAGESLRPPGAQGEPDFLASCIKCGQCVEACPFDTLDLATASERRAIGVPYLRSTKTLARLLTTADNVSRKFRVSRLNTGWPARYCSPPIPCT